MRRFFFFIGMSIFALVLWERIIFIPHDNRENISTEKKSVSLWISGNEYHFRDVVEKSVDDFLITKGYSSNEKEQVFPARSEKLLPGTIIFFEPARSVHLTVDKRNERLITSKQTAEMILEEAGIVLDEDDLVIPLREASVSENATIVVTRVLVQEEIKDTNIPFITQTIEDEDLSWRKKEIRQKGKFGTKRTIYRVSYHDGKEIVRKVLRTEIVESPVEEILVQGTYVKIGKTHKGAASWYAWTGTMAAANPWLPLGSYVRVTNLENGKSVIVKINDRGPFVPGRIIDLDKVAFQKIASIGAGVINIKMEEITN